MAEVTPPRELRLALAMKGGVSLAVWMGGACREIARMREENAAPGNGPRYRALLRLCGYDSVLVDVLSGSSAGGLNGVLLSQHIASGARFDDGVRDVWLRVGDLHQLARRPWSDPPLSLLHGDQAFYRQLVRAMRDLRTADPSRMGEHPLRLLVTATRLHGRTDALFPSIGQPLVARSNEGFCRFRYPGIADSLYVSRRIRGDQEVNDFLESDEADRRLAYAARTTSSFPGAFEPAEPWVARPDADEEVNLYGISSETGTEDPGHPGRVELVDGGLLDNIPIAWAVRSIAGMPAQAPVDRWLLYLEPVPENKLAPDGSTQQSSSVLGMIKLLTTSLLVKSSTESVLDDAQVLTETEGLADAQRASMVASLALAGSEGLREAAAEEVDPAYVQLLGQMEISRLRQLLLDPFSLVAPDPLPVPPNTFAHDQLQVVGDESRAQVPLLRPVSDEEAALFSGPLQSTDVMGPLGLRAQSPLVAARAVTLLLEAVRTAEQRGKVPSPGLRDRLYALRLATEMVVATRDRALLEGAGDHLLRATTDDGVPAAVALLHQANRRVSAMLATLERPEPVAGLSQADDNFAMARFWRRWAYDLAALSVDEPAGDHHGNAEEPYAVLWEGMQGCQEALVLIGAAQGELSETLCSLEVLVGSQRPDPLSAPAVPRFAVMSASNRSPLEARLLPGEITDRNRVDRKLSGNQVANFAGFLSARWRHNDWIWGRLDGAQTLATVIAAPERIAAALRADAATTDPRRVLREFFVDGAADPEWSDFFAHRWSELEAELASGDRPVEDWFVDVATERLQWDILAAEMGCFQQLNDRVVGRDDPPDAEMAPEPASAPPEHLDALGAVGAESVLSLIRRAELRRTLVQLGLIIWRAIVGTGSGLKQVAAWAIAPMIVTPTLLCTVSPFWTVFAAVFSWIAISAVTGDMASVAHLPVIIGLSMSSFMIAAHLRGGRRWPLRLAPLGVIVIGFVGWLVVYRLGWAFPFRSAVAQAVWTGLFSGAAFGVTQIDVVWASFRRRTTRALSPLWLVGAIGVVTMVGAVITLLPDHAAAGFALQYVALALGLVGLYLWTDKSAVRQQPLDGWPDDEQPEATIRSRRPNRP